MTDWPTFPYESAPTPSSQSTNTTTPSHHETAPSVSPLPRPSSPSSSFASTHGHLLASIMRDPTSGIPTSLHPDALPSDIDRPAGSSPKANMDAHEPVISEDDDGSRRKATDKAGGDLLSTLNFQPTMLPVEHLKRTTSPPPIQREQQGVFPTLAAVGTLPEGSTAGIQRRRSSAGAANMMMPTVAEVRNFKQLSMQSPFRAACILGRTTIG